MAPNTTYTSPAISFAVIFRDRPATVALCLYALVAFYNLGVPSLWMDEILVPMTAAHSMEFILNQTTYIEVHPPLFYYFVKLFQMLSNDDFTMRLFSVLCGLGTCIFGYATASLILPLPKTRAALLFLMANSQFLFLIRNVRPYACMVLLFSVVFYLYFRLCEDEKPSLGHAILIGCLLCLSFALVYTSLFIIVAVIGSLALVGLLRRRAALFVPALVLSVVLGLFLAGFYTLFISKSAISQVYLNANMDFATITDIYINAVLDNLFYFNNIAARLILAALALHGLWLLRDNRPFCILALALLVVPYAQLMITKSAVNFWGRHVAFLMLPFAIAQARSAAALLSQISPTAPALAAAALGLVTLGGYHHKYFAVDSYDVDVIGDNYKSIARHLVDTAVPGQALNYTGDYLEKCTNWYINRFLSPNERINDSGSDAPVQSVIVAKEYLYLGGSKEGFIERFGPFDSEEPFRSVTIFRRAIAKIGPVPMVTTPFQRAFVFDYNRLYAEAATVSNLNLATSSRGFSLVPTRTDIPATCDYVFTNPAGNAHFGVVLDYRSAGWGNGVAVDVRFDDEPFTTVFATGGMDARRQAIIHFERHTPVATLTVRLRLLCHDSLPTSPGTGLRTVSVEGFTLIAASDATTVVNKLGPAAYNAYLLENYESERFPTAIGIVQQLTYDPAVIVCQRPDDVDDKRVAVCALRSGHDSGDINIRYTAPHNDAMFLPRISGETSLLVTQFLAPDGAATGFFTMRGNSNTHWTPISAQYKLPLPALSGIVRVHLEGAAQLWTVDGKALFRSR